MKLPFEPKLRTPAEIWDFLQTPSADGLGFDHEAVLPFASAETLIALAEKRGIAKPSEEGLRFLIKPSVDVIVGEMREYMEFAWTKVRDHRGISAMRNVAKMRAWMWLIGDVEGRTEMGAIDYSQYGAPMLDFICRRYGFPIPDDEATQNMIAGNPCEPDCDLGCGT